FGQFARCKGGASQTVAPSFSANIKNRITDSAGRTAGKSLMSQHAETENIHQRIALETFVEIDFTADDRNADAVAIMCDAGDNAGKQSPVVFDLGFGIWGLRSAFCDWSKAERVQTKLGPCAHGEDVANDSADSRGRSL